MPECDTITEMVHAVRERLRGLQEEDAKLTNQFYLARWLRANELDVDRTIRAIRANRKWRRENNIDELLKQDPDQVYSSRLPYFYDVRGKHGRPVIYTYGAGLVKGFNQSDAIHQMVHHVVKIEQAVLDWDNEWHGSVDEMPKERLEGAFNVIDCGGASLRGSLLAMPMLLEFSRTVTNYFPTTGRGACIINASKLVDVPLKVLRPIMTSTGVTLSVLSKGAKAEEWDREIFQIITPEQLKEQQVRAQQLYKSSMTDLEASSVSAQ